MRNVKVSEARTHLARLLDEVERGQTVAITRRGRAIAYIVPEPKPRREEACEAVERIKRLRSQFRGVSLKELMDARHEGYSV